MKFEFKVALLPPVTRSCFAYALPASALSVAVWRNGSASDPRSEGWEFESLCGHMHSCSKFCGASCRGPRAHCGPTSNTQRSPLNQNTHDCTPANHTRDVRRVCQHTPTTAYRARVPKHGGTRHAPKRQRRSLRVISMRPPCDILVRDPLARGMKMWI